MPNATESLRKLFKLNVHDLGDKVYLSKICEIRLGFSTSPSEISAAFRLKDEVNTKLAEVLGLDPHTKFSEEDVKHIFEALADNSSVEAIAQMFAGTLV